MKLTDEWYPSDMLDLACNFGIFHALIMDKEGRRIPTFKAGGGESDPEAQEVG